MNKTTEQVRTLSVDELKAAWNAQSDALNQWEELGLDEIAELAQANMLSRVRAEMDRMRECMERAADELEPIDDETAQFQCSALRACLAALSPTAGAW